MKIRNVLHKGLRRLIEDEDASGVQPAVADKLRRDHDEIEIEIIDLDHDDYH